MLEASQPDTETRYITLKPEGGCSERATLEEVADHAIVVYRRNDQRLPEADRCVF